jgi:hypothetical protein
MASAACSELPDGAYPAAGDDGVAGRMVPFDVGHADLLRSDCVARAVQQLLEAR